MGRWQELQQAMSAGVEAAIDAGWDRQAVYGLVESAIKTRVSCRLSKRKQQSRNCFLKWKKWALQRMSDYFAFRLIVRKKSSRYCYGN